MASLVTELNVTVITFDLLCFLQSVPENQSSQSAAQMETNVHSELWRTFMYSYNSCVILRWNKQKLTHVLCFVFSHIWVFVLFLITYCFMFILQKDGEFTGRLFEQSDQRELHSSASCVIKRVNMSSPRLLILFCLVNIKVAFHVMFPEQRSNKTKRVNECVPSLFSSHLHGDKCTC